LEIPPEVMMKRNLLDPWVQHLFDGTDIDWQNPALTGWRRTEIVDPVLEKFKKS